MYCNLVSQSYNSQNAILKLTNLTPKPHSTIRLNFRADRILDDGDTPFSSKIWPLA